MRVRTLTLMLMLTTCVRTSLPRPPEPVSPSPPPPPPPWSIPDGCEADLSGPWCSADGRLRYEAEDDGSLVQFVAFAAAPADAGTRRRFSRDGGLPWLVPPPPALTPEREVPLGVLVLERSSGGFVGTVTRSVHPDGGCVPVFWARVTACSDARLEFETVQQGRFDAECRLLDGGVVTLVVMTRPAPAADGGAVDGGGSPDASGFGDP